MNLRTVTKAASVLAMAAVMSFNTHVVTTAQAEMLSTEAAISKYAAHADRQFLLSEIQRDEIRQEIIDMGVDPDEAEARLMALTDEEVAQMVEQMDAGSAGADGIIGALFTVFVILLVTDILCLTKVFNFTRCAR
ncbi:MAG: PA2779 family protein [Pseudomonadota bacterium]